MGNAARNRRRGGVRPRSAYVAVRREIEWSLDHPNGFEGLSMAKGSMAALRSSQLRIVEFPAGQAGAFRSYGDDLKAAAAMARPPFEVTFYDFGFLRVAGYEIAGAVVVAPEGPENWTAISYLRQAGTQDWSEALLTGDSIASRGRFPFGQLGADQGRPPMEDAATAATLIICGALTFLESANVELIETDGPGPGHQAAGIPHHEVVVRPSSRRYRYPANTDHADAEWSHRWEVSGHFKHFRRGRIFDKNPGRQLEAYGERFVRIWCPPHVKGPTDKPLIPKVRRVVVG